MMTSWLYRASASSVVSKYIGSVMACAKSARSKGSGCAGAMSCTRKACGKTNDSGFNPASISPASSFSWSISSLYFEP